MTVQFPSGFMRESARITETDTGWRVEGTAYVLEVDRSRPVVRLTDSDGELWTELRLDAGVDVVGAADETLGTGGTTLRRLSKDAPASGVETPAVARGSLVSTPHPTDACSTGFRDEPAYLFRHDRTSSVWASATTWVRCAAGSVEIWHTVAGVAQRLTDVTLAGHRAILGNGAGGEFRSRIGYASVFVPAPSEPVRFVRPAGTPARLGVSGDAEPGRLNGIFSPPPLVLGFGRVPAGAGAQLPEGGEWLGVGLVGGIDELRFTTADYEPLDGGWRWRLAYEGHTTASSWTSPRLVLYPAAGIGEVLDGYREYVRESLVSTPPPPGACSTGLSPDWWYEPIFCGWGAQCATPGVQPAPRLARQELYDAWLGHLAGHGIVPGTVVIDDKWQAQYATLAVDQDKWPDLTGWIAARHAAGQHVLLWYKAWDPEGLPASECITTPDGRPVAADPGNPAYRRRLRDAVTWALSPTGLDADGFKVDFTQRTPSGQSLVPDRPWGIAALHTLLATLYGAAKAAKPDALVVTHTVHPLFADVTDMIRLNDILSTDLPDRGASPAAQMATRALIVRHTLPGVPIDTDQWPMPDRASWLEYVDAQPALGVPALYYVDRIDNSGEALTDDDLARVAAAWW